MLIGIDASRSTAPRLTGTERYSRAVIDALLTAGAAHRFRLYAREVVPSDPRAETVVIPRARLWTHLGLGPALRADPPDALFIPAHVLPFGVGLTGHPRAVVTLHDVGYRHFPAAHPLRQRLYLEASTWFSARRAQAVIADSRSCAADLQRFYGVPAGRITVAYPGPILAPMPPSDEGAALRAGLGVPADEHYLLFIGTQQPRKNLRRLLEALTRPALADARLVIVGGRGWGGEDPPAEAARLGVADRVRFLGYIGETEKAALLQGARALAMPSLYEGFGFPVLEAQAAGVPVVASNTSSLPEAAGEGALFVDPLDVEDIAHGLSRALNDDAARAEVIARGQVNVRRFSWERCAGQILDALQGGRP
ncbi:MAG: glycosyltransferase family 4 protein [Thermoflexales bacterium]|nr:glycosyltransferase family 4 protein [Thermoflexales bacterium]